MGEYAITLINLALSQLEQSRMASVAAIEGAVIIEAEYQKYYHEIWLAKLSKEVALQRLMERSPDLGEEDARKRIKFQIDDDERLKFASFV